MASAISGRAGRTFLQPLVEVDVFGVVRRGQEEEEEEVCAVPTPVAELQEEWSGI